tara:strand:+ start:3068 stop:4591 length:1524 start_codon:yes stop_codon:yes gene_type:complete
MCGILGVIGDIDPDKFNKCLGKIKSRGPDSTKTTTRDGITMGINRLAVNGSERSAEQPFSNDTITTVCNGEIFNHGDLEKKYSYAPRSSSDCEVLVPHLELGGTPTEICNSLDAEFSLISYNSKTRKVLVARDPYGVRPLFWGRTLEGGFAFASELKAIYTICDHVTQFNPGWYMELDCSHQDVKFIYAKYRKEISIQKSKNVLPNIANILEKAVKKRLMCENGGVCCLLSGGLDSSLIAALANKNSPRPIHTFSIGMSGSPDLRYAREVSSWIGSVHHEVCLEAQEFCEAIPEVIKAIESYDVTTVRASVGNYLVAKYIRENTDFTVVLNGDYSDEVTGGYLYMKMAPDYQEFHQECLRLVDNIHFFDSLRSDRTICAWGLEARTPFADKEFVEYYLSVDPKITSPKDAIGKFALREAFRGTGLLPDSVLNRKKEAFSDGISPADNSWHNIVHDYLIQLGHPSEEHAYRAMFSKFYRHHDNVIPYKWMPKYCDAKDPSARNLEIYT